jgi:hypothetical protein
VLVDSGYRYHCRFTKTIKGKRFGDSDFDCQEGSCM